MRLPVVESGHEPQEAAALELVRSMRGGYVPDVLKTLHYRPEIFGRPFSTVLHTAMRGPSDWTPGERELFAAYTSSLNQCPF
ncbi:MAG TPA: hypothetical protein VGN06_02175 [Gaiellaceae bacterium]